MCLALHRHRRTTPQNYTYKKDHIGTAPATGLETAPAHKRPTESAIGPWHTARCLLLSRSLLTISKMQSQHPPHQPSAFSNQTQLASRSDKPCQTVTSFHTTPESVGNLPARGALVLDLSTANDIMVTVIIIGSGAKNKALTHAKILCQFFCLHLLLVLGMHIHAANCQHGLETIESLCCAVCCLPPSCTTSAGPLHNLQLLYGTCSCPRLLPTQYLS